MKGERQQQDQIQKNEERPLMNSADEQVREADLTPKGSAVPSPAEPEVSSVRREAALPLNRTYFKRTGLQPSFLVLRDGRNDRPAPRPEGGAIPAGPCLIRSEEWLQAPELTSLYDSWLASEDGPAADRALQRIYYRLRAEAAELLESPDGDWAVVTLLSPPELAGRRSRLASLQDAQLEALFAAVAERQRQGGECRLDLLAPSPASAAEFAAQREFIEEVADQTLGHAFAAACRIGALIAPDAERAAAGEIARIADFLVLDGAAGEAAPEEDAAQDFVAAAGQVLAAVRRVRPAAVVFAAGAAAAPALADLYEIGLSGIFCSAGQRTEALLRAACLTWIARQENMDTAAGGGL
ncbi:hypothetical protein ACFRAM_24650 [Paenibacillus sp. NPDC056722]|uniref:hypothetical protein n=1 Tax=Paenibacillus sp. NPDC056722 TaxID=3345924 RepID=UPI0036D09475